MPYRVGQPQGLRATTRDCPYQSRFGVGAIWNGCPTRWESHDNSGCVVKKNFPIE